MDEIMSNEQSSSR